MKTTIRIRYFLWLAALMGFMFLFQLTLWGVYEVSEWRKGEAESLSEELEEIGVILAVYAITMPIMLALGWGLSGRLLRPLRSMAHTAQRISSGELYERIKVDTAGDEIELLAGAANQAFDRYGDAVDQMKRFSGDASHQLRTPLTAMRSTGEVCLQTERSQAEYRDAIGSMLEEVHRLSVTVEQLLMLSRLDFPDVREQFSAMEWSDIVSETCEQYRPLAESQGITLRGQLHTGAVIQGEPTLIQQVVANLLDNAIRFTPTGGEVVVSVDAHGDGYAVLTVADTGPGIPDAYRESVFDRFRRVPGSESQGAGLGLAIVADIVKVHGGTVEVGAGSPGGAVFRVRLPEVPPA